MATVTPPIGIADALALVIVVGGGFAIALLPHPDPIFGSAITLVLGIYFGRASKGTA